MFGRGDAGGGPCLEEGCDAGVAGVEVAPSAVWWDLCWGGESRNVMTRGCSATTSDGGAEGTQIAYRGRVRGEGFDVRCQKRSQSPSDQVERASIPRMAGRRGTPYLHDGRTKRNHVVQLRGVVLEILQRTLCCEIVYLCTPRSYGWKGAQEHCLCTRARQWEHHRRHQDVGVTFDQYISGWVASLFGE